MIALSFQDTNGKLVLINDFYEKIGYPTQGIQQDRGRGGRLLPEEDMKWDRLHKHGL